MSPILGWLLVAVLGVVSWQSYGWRGVAIAASLVVFWLLLQFNRTVRVMQNAAQQPLGHVPSAVMFQAGLRRGLTMLKIVKATRTLGRKAEASDGADDWIWSDDGGVSVRLHFERGVLVRWQLERRPSEPADPLDAPP
ncbi:MAG: hypothetical protein M3Z29_01295 [Pseudomonadota bacterium]|nr:hypothetical protein [Pseudomonadota bacterium]